MAMVLVCTYRLGGGSSKQGRACVVGLRILTVPVSSRHEDGEFGPWTSLLPSLALSPFVCDQALLSVLWSQET